jgi:hypothetical protein
MVRLETRQTNGGAGQSVCFQEFGRDNIPVTVLQAGVQSVRRIALVQFISNNEMQKCFALPWGSKVVAKFWIHGIKSFCDRSVREKD